jgi:hypothetical protein
MQINRFSKHLRATALTFIGLVAAAAAHADPGTNLSNAVTTQLLDSTRQCADMDAVLTKLRFPTGTKFLLTDAGLVMVDQPHPRAWATKWEPEWPNSGN